MNSELGVVEPKAQTIELGRRLMQHRVEQTVRAIEAKRAGGG